jgi:hypothetical protein
MSKGRRHTIRTHPEMERIKELIVSKDAIYREIGERFGVSVSAVKRFALEIKNEPSNRTIANRNETEHCAESETNRKPVHERQVLEESACLRKKQSEKDRENELRRRYALTQQPSKPKPKSWPDNIRVPYANSLEEYNLRMARMRFETMKAIEEEERRQREYNPLDW